MVDWITTKRDGNTISVTAAKNTGAARSTYLTIQGNGLTLKIPITQEKGIPPTKGYIIVGGSNTGQIFNIQL